LPYNTQTQSTHTGNGFPHCPSDLKSRSKKGDRHALLTRDDCWEDCCHAMLRPSEDHEAVDIDGLHLLDSSEAAESSGSATTFMRVNGICCPAEVPLIDGILLAIEGVTSVEVSVPTKTVICKHSARLVPASVLVDSLNDAGLQAHLKHEQRSRAQAPTNARECLAGTEWMPPAHILLGAALTVLASLHRVSRDASFLRDFGLAAVAVCAPPVLQRAWNSLRNGLLDINTLMTVAVCGAMIIGEFPEAAATMVLFGLSEWLEERSMSRASTAIEAVLSLRPERALLVGQHQAFGADDHLHEEIAISEVRRGMRLAVPTGEKIPADGVVLYGSASVDESTLTGEAVPVHKTVGDPVYAGTISASGYLEMKASVDALDSTVSRLARLVEEAQARRTNGERIVEAFSRWYTPVVVVVALCVGTIPHFAFGLSATRWIYTACVLLVVACPCAVVLSTPVVTVSALAAAAHRGVVIKGGAFLEALGHLEVLALDKTGTLTTGQFRVQHIEVLESSGGGGGRGGRGEGGREQETMLLHLASSVEAQSSHPMAKAVVERARLVGGAALPAPSGEIDDFEILPGEGVQATVGGELVQVGNGAMARRLGWLTQRHVAARAPALEEAWARDGHTVSYVALENRVVGMFSSADTVRAGAVDAVGTLVAAGVRPVMLTGDNAGAAASAAREVGVTDVHAGLKPGDKLARIRSLQEGLSECPRRWMRGSPTLAMVGDGVNDGPALAEANIGIAMGVAGSAVALETADVALFTNDLGVLAETVLLGRTALRKVQQNIAFAVLVKAVVLATSFMGWTGLWVAIMADVGSALAVISNGLLILRNKHSEKALRRHHCLGHAHADGHGHGHGHGHDQSPLKPRCCESGACTASKAAPSKPATSAKDDCCASGACTAAKSAAPLLANEGTNCCASGTCTAGKEEAPLLANEDHCCASGTCTAGGKEEAVPLPTAEAAAPAFLAREENITPRSSDCCASGQCGSSAGPFQL